MQHYFKDYQSTADHQWLVAPGKEGAYLRIVIREYNEHSIQESMPCIA